MKQHMTTQRGGRLCGRGIECSTDSCAHCARRMQRLIDFIESVAAMNQPGTLSVSLAERADEILVDYGIRDPRMRIKQIKDGGKLSEDTHDARVVDVKRRGGNLILTVEVQR